MKPIRWTTHALKQAAAREISAAEVEQALAHPDAITAGQPPRQIFMRRYFDGLLQTEMLLRVVVEETEAERVVVSLYKTSRFAKYLPG